MLDILSIRTSYPKKQTNFSNFTMANTIEQTNGRTIFGISLKELKWQDSQKKNKKKYDKKEEIKN